MIQSFRTGLALSVVFLTVTGWAKEVTLTVKENAEIAAQLAAEGKTLADGDSLVKEGGGQLTMDQENGARLSGGTVKAGTLAVYPKNGLGKQGADWTVEDGATIRIGGSGSYNFKLKFRLSGTGVGGVGALAVYDATFETSSGCDFILDDDALMTVSNDHDYTGLFTAACFYFEGHTLTVKGATSTATIRQRLGGQVYGSGTLVLDGVQYTSGGVSDGNYFYYGGSRTVRLVNGSSYRVNVQKQFDAFETFDGAAGTTLRTDSGSLAAAAFKNLTGALTLDASLQAVTVNGNLKARGADLASGNCLNCSQEVTFGNGATVDLEDDEAVESGREYAIATATGGFVGPLPHVVGRAYRRQAVLRFSDDRKTLLATFGEVPVEKDYGSVLAWYRFDDFPVGTTFGQDMPVVNEVSPSLGLGRVQLLDKTSVAATGIAPRAAQPSELTEVYDPLTGVTFANRASIDFATEAYGAGSTKGAEILVSGDRSNRPEKSVTLEAFVCSTGGVYNLMAPIVSLTGAGERTGESLALLVNANGNICARFRTKDMAEATIWNHTRAAGDQLFDGHWHHVALVYDAMEGRMTMYVDYRQDSTIAADTSGLRYSAAEADSTVYIGGYLEPDGRKFNGRIDEVRITGAALAPEHFLRRRRPAEFGRGVLDERTLFFAPMSGGTTGEAARDNVNAATNTPSAYVRNLPDVSAAFGADAPAAGVRGSHRRIASVPAGTLTVGGTSGSAGAVIEQDEYLDWFGDDLTIEGYFKTADSRESQTIVGLDTASGYALKLMVHDGGKFYLAGNTPGWWGHPLTAGGVLADGAWHHFAVVYDKAAGTLTAAVDGAFMTHANVGTVASARLTIGANRKSNGDVEQAFTGKIGPVRVTRGKLQPCAWLSAVDPAEADPTMRDGVAFHLRGLTEEGLLDVQPYPSSRTPGETATLSVSGAALPTFTPTVRQPQYFLYGEESGLVATNTGSVHLENSALVFRGDRALDARSQTVECLAKFSSIGDAAHLFRLGMTEGANAEQAANRVIAYIARGALVVSLSVDDGGTAGYFDHTTPIGASELTGGWHHLAISWDEDPSAGTTTVRTYLDYRLRAEVVADKLIWHPTTLTRHSLAIGYSNPVTNEGLVGDIDEFRITEGVLQPEAFIRKVPRHLGLLMIVR